METINQMIEWMQNSNLLHALISLIFTDIILGTARALIDKSFNSSIGKKGLIIKVTMILCAIGSVFIDYALNINFLGIIPQEIANMLCLGEVGFCEATIILFGVYELTSILKNWSYLGLPGAKKLQGLLEKYTNELI